MLNINNLQLYKIIDPECIREISDIKYGIENYEMIRVNAKLKIKILKIKST